MQTRGTKLANGVIVETKDNLKDFLFAILQDNDAQQRTNGLPESNLVELYQQSMEAAELLSKVSTPDFEVFVASTINPVRRSLQATPAECAREEA